ncbi:MAG: class I SAM-dependent methyltransferase [Patescibacteria group bacterium]|nr:class I SAM-dependent methyltransferase [Patescibacteria group bacterium]MDE2590357.1 class I SAM-dependent methyltransferase [Patescibacteria group bacterium]
MESLVCAICKTNKYTKVLYPANFDKKALTSKIFSARRTPDRIHYRFLRCQKCGLIFSNPVLPLGQIKKLYAASDFTYSNESTFLAKTYWDNLQHILPEKGKDKLKLLDIGCGNGFFLEEAKKQGIGYVYGIEPGKPLVKRARMDIRPNIKTDLLRPGLFPNNYFDIICCFHTLDHCIDPNEFIRLSYKMLKKGGYAFFVTHTTNGLSVKLFGEKSPIFDVEHIYLFNEETLAKMFRQNKFIKTNVFNLKNTYPLSYWLRLTPVPKLLKAPLIAILRTAHLLSTPVSVTAGNIGITAKK